MSSANVRGRAGRKLESSREIPSLSASDIAQLVRSRDISPVDVVEAHLGRIEALNDQLNAFAWLDADRAIEAARLLEARAAARGELPKLCGVPVTIKSSIDVAGLRCEAGSRLRADHIPTQDAPLVQRLKSAGAIVLGVTNAPEMLMAYETANLLHGHTSNPWDLTRTPGGSSGGEAAAIASGMSAAGIGSDGGGSIRVPAHFTGICGLKPTPGRIPGTGHFPECVGPWATMGVVGPMARTIADLRLLWSVLAGPDDGDPMSAPIATSAEEKGLAGARIALLEAEGISITPETRATVSAAARAVEQAGATLEPLRIEDFPEALRIWQMLFCSASAVAVRAFVQGSELELSPLLRDFLAYVEQQPPLTVESLLFGLVARDEVRTRVLRQMRPYTAMIAPVSSGPAFHHGEGGWGASHPQNYIETMCCSQFANALGLPALVLPAGRSREGLPIGVQLIGRPYSEEALFAAGAALEARFSFQWPPLVRAKGVVAR